MHFPHKLCPYLSFTRNNGVVDQVPGLFNRFAKGYSPMVVQDKNLLFLVFVDDVFEDGFVFVRFEDALKIRPISLILQKTYNFIIQIRARPNDHGLLIDGQKTTLHCANSRYRRMMDVQSAVDIWAVFVEGRVDDISGAIEAVFSRSPI